MPAPTDEELIAAFLAEMKGKPQGEMVQALAGTITQQGISAWVNAPPGNRKIKSDTTRRRLRIFLGYETEDESPAARAIQMLQEARADITKRLDEAIADLEAARIDIGTATRSRAASSASREARKPKKAKPTDTGRSGASG